MWISALFSKIWAACSCTLSSRAIRLGTFCCKNCGRKRELREDFYAGVFLMVHQFWGLISLETTKTSLILIQIEENWVLCLKLVENRIYLSAPFIRLWSLKTIVVCYISQKLPYLNCMSFQNILLHSHLNNTNYIYRRPCSCMFQDTLSHRMDHTRRVV